MWGEREIRRVLNATSQTTTISAVIMTYLCHTENGETERLVISYRGSQRLRHTHNDTVYCTYLHRYCQGARGPTTATMDILREPRRHRSQNQERKNEQRLPCMPVAAFGRATGSRPSSWRGRPTGVIRLPTTTTPQKPWGLLWTFRRRRIQNTMCQL